MKESDQHLEGSVQVLEGNLAWIKRRCMFAALKS